MYYIDNIVIAKEAKIMGVIIIIVVVILKQGLLCRPHWPSTCHGSIAFWVLRLQVCTISRYMRYWR